MFGYPLFDFAHDSVVGGLIFHGLVWSALLVIPGVLLAFSRRVRDHDAAALQDFQEDFLPLFILFAVSVTGLLLTVSYTWMKGYGYDFLALLHAVTVIAMLLWLPFGKFFHIFQRPAQLAISSTGTSGGGGPGPVRGATSRSPPRPRPRPDPGGGRVGLPVRHARPAGGRYQHVCPACRRRTLALAQHAAWHPHPEEARMAVEATPTPELLAKFGPLRATRPAPAGTGLDPDKLVKTHCCFCGQQCGIQLKVKDNQVVGFEPWTDFPFNQGMLCPKGVRRYLQSSHHDRLTSATPATRPGPGFRPIPYDEAIRRVASEIQRIQSTYGNDAFAVLGGASMTTEKCYLLGKFARVCLKTRHIDYNGRLCMVSAAAGNKKAFGIDRPGTRWPTFRWPRSSGSAGRTWPSAPNRRATSGRPARTGRRSSTWTRGSPRSPGPAT